MELSLEIPIPEIELFLPLTDFPFGLAQLVLRKTQEGYRYCELMQGCLLDNGMYELGESLSVGDLIKAATLCNPVAVIAPDWEDEMQLTIDAARELLKASKGQPWTVGALVQGLDLEERNNCFYELKAMHLRPIGFPFRSPRGEVIDQLLREGMFDETGWYHLFGLRDNSELSMELPGKWSVDTGKPFKGFLMDRGPIRGRGRLNLHKELSRATRTAALWNIAWMRKEMR